MTPEPSPEERRRAALLVEFFDAVAGADDEADVLEAAANAARWIGDASGILVLSPDRSRLELAVVKAVDPEAEALIRELSAASPLGAHEGVAGRVISTGEPYAGEVPERFPLRSFLAVPMATKQETIGVLEVARYRSAERYTADDLSFLAGVAARAALAYANLRVHRLVRANAARGAQVLADSPLPTVLLGTDLRVESWNRAAERLFGWTAQEFVGRRQIPMVPVDREAEALDFERRLAAGETIEGVETVRVAKDGTRIDVAIYAARFGGPIADGIAVRFVDLRERRRLEAIARDEAARAERQRQREQVVAEFFADVARADDDPSIFGSLAEHVVRIVRSAAATYRLTPDGDPVELVALAAGGGERISVGSVGEAQRAALRATVGELHVSGDAPGEAPGRIAVPLLAGGRRIGYVAAVRIGDDAEPFDETDFAFVRTLATRSTFAFERVAAQRAARSDAERAQILGEFVALASDARDEREALEQLARRTAAALACACSIYRANADGTILDVLTLAGYRKADEDGLWAMFGRQPWRATEGNIGHCYGSGETVFRSYMPADERAAYLDSLPDDRKVVMGGIDLRAIIAVPLEVGGRRIGVLALSRFGEAAEPFAAHDCTFAEELAARANLALGRLALAAERDLEAARARVIAEFVDAAAGAADERDLLLRLSQAASDAFEGSLAIYRLTPDGRELDAVALTSHDDTADAFREMYSRQRWRADEGLMGRALGTRQTVFRAYLAAEERTAYLASLPEDRRPDMEARDLRAIIAVPLSEGEQQIGILTLARYGPEAQPFSDHDRAFAEDLASRANLALGRLTLGAELRRTSATLRAMFDASPLATQLLDADGRVLLWNPAAERLFGFSADEVIGNQPPTIPPSEVPAARDIASRVGRGERVEGMPAKRVRKDGSEIDVLLYGSAILDERGETRVLGIYADMTERNRLERELRQASDTLRAILDGSPLPIMAADEAMRVTFWNHAAERLYGWTAAEMIGKMPPFMPADAPGVVERWRARLAAGETVEGETRRRTKDGRELEIRLHSAPLFDEVGGYRGALGIHEDVTERKRLEAELLQAQKMETVGRLAGGVAHDFNNILTAIIGYSDLAEDMADEPELLRVLATVKAAAERAAGLTQQLLAFSRRQMLQPKVIEANDVILEIEPILRRVIGEDIELAASITPDVGSVLVDPTQLEQVILNLAVNARDAMPDGGRLVLRTEAAHFNGDHHPHLEMSPGDYVVISVADTGTGMDEETKAHIFEPFFTTKALGKGTGLGLSTTYGIVRQSGGYIWVYSEPGRGTTFKLYFPRVGSPQPAEPEPETATGTRRGRILLVEDEPTLRELAGIVLKRRGYEVLVARGPAAALELADGSTFDLLATDVVMPGMTGIELARRLRERQPGLRVLFMSGYSEDVTDAAGSMTRRFLAKPFTPDSLLRAVDEAITAETHEPR